MIGRNNNVVAVLLVTSVKKEIKNAIKIIIRNRWKSFKKNNDSPSQLANPDEVTNDAKLKPPPKRIKIFQGILLNQSFFKIAPSLPVGKMKNNIAPKIAIFESLKDILKKSLI